MNISGGPTAVGNTSLPLADKKLDLEQWLLGSASNHKYEINHNVTCNNSRWKVLANPVTGTQLQVVNKLPRILKVDVNEEMDIRQSFLYFSI